MTIRDVPPQLRGNVLREISRARMGKRQKGYDSICAAVLGLAVLAIVGTIFAAGMKGYGWFWVLACASGALIACSLLFASSVLVFPLHLMISPRFERFGPLFSEEITDDELDTVVEALEVGLKSIEDPVREKINSARDKYSKARIYYEGFIESKRGFSDALSLRSTLVASDYCEQVRDRLADLEVQEKRLEAILSSPKEQFEALKGHLAEIRLNDVMASAANLVRSGDRDVEALKATLECLAISCIGIDDSVTSVSNSVQALAAACSELSCTPKGVTTQID